MKYVVKKINLENDINVITFKLNNLMIIYLNSKKC